MYDYKSITANGATKHAGKDTYFRDVHVFIERIRDIAQTQDIEITEVEPVDMLSGSDFRLSPELPNFSAVPTPRILSSLEQISDSRTFRPITSV